MSANTPPEDNSKPSVAFLFSIGLISAASLGCEILLMRLFSIIQWHHFAYMMISLALLGYAVSGSFITLMGERLSRRFDHAYMINALLFSLMAPGSFFLAQKINFNPLEILWDKGQWLRLAEIFLLLMLPFLFAANCICLSFLRYRKHINRIYSADLIGAGSGALGVILLLYWLFPLTILGLISALALAAMALLLTDRRQLKPATICAGFALLLPVLVWHSDLQIKPVTYKSLSQTLNQIGTQVLEQRSGPLGLITVVASPDIPFREAPGLSLLSRSLPPEQLGLFVDADSLSAITHFDGDLSRLDYLHEMPSALPYVLLQQPEVLILGSGGGSALLQALWHDASRIDAVELNADIVDLLRHQFAAYSGGIYNHEKIHVHVAEARGFLESTPALNEGKYDLIQIELLGAFNASSAGLFALSETYIYTVEAMQKALQHLKPDGLLSLGRWVQLPPRDGPRLFATITEALQEQGITDIAERLIWIRSWNMSLILVKNGRFDQTEIRQIKTFCSSRAFDLVWYPGISENEVNQYNRLSQPFFYQAAVALLGEEREKYIDQYKFNITPVTDDKPYFFRFFRWRALPELLAQGKTGGYSLLDLGYLVLIATLILAVIFSVILVMLPLLVNRTVRKVIFASQSRVAIYFSCLGFAFIFIEIAFMQRFSLYLAHPVISAATLLSAFLVFAGLGSRCTGREKNRRFLIRVVAGIILISSTYLLFLSQLFNASMAYSNVSKIIFSVILIAPLALLMGMPFPIGLSRLAGEQNDTNDRLVAWAWCVNGCASIIGAVLATLLAMHLGISAVIILALLFYGIALMSLPDYQ